MKHRYWQMFLWDSRPNRGSLRLNLEGGIREEAGGVEGLEQSWEMEGV